MTFMAHELVTAAKLNRSFFGAVTPYSYGAVGDGVADDTTAVQAAITAAGANGNVSFPPGTFKVTSALTVPSYQVWTGAGKISTIAYSGSGTMVTLTSQREVKFVGMHFTLSASTALLFDLSNCYRVSWHRCYLNGTRSAAASSGTTTGQVGIKFRDNTGDCMLYDCDVANFTVGIETSATQNGVVGGKFGTNNYSIHATGNGGMALGGYVDFVSGFDVDGTTPLTDAHIWAHGSDGQWWLSNVWIEGCNYGIIIGSATTGPTQFGMSNCKVAATTTCVTVNTARNPILHNVQVAGDRSNVATPAAIAVNSTQCPEGVAFIDSLTTAVDETQFPIGWTYQIRAGSTSVFKMPNTTKITYGGTLQMQRSDNSWIQTLAMASGPVLEVRGASSAGTSVRVKDAGGANIFEIDSAASRVNFVGTVPAATGVGPSLAARGTDTDIDLVLSGKGVGGVRLNSPTGVRWVSGTGSPESVVTAPIGSLYSRLDGGASTTLYVKQSGTGNTGWAAK